MHFIQHKSLFAGANVYIPVGTTTHLAPAFNTVETQSIGHDQRHIYYGIGQEKAMTGVDGELGYEFIPGLTTYLGVYGFTASGVKSAVGPKARFIYEWSEIAQGKKVLGVFDGISVEAEVRHDKPRGTDVYAGLRFRVGLGKNEALTGVQRHMVDRVRRDINLVTQGNATEKHRLNNSDGSAVLVQDMYVYNAEELNQAFENANTNVIAVFGNIGEVSELAVWDNLTVTGGDYDFTAQGQDFSIQLVDSNNRGSIQAMANSTLFNLDNFQGTATFQDMDLVGENFTAIGGNNLGNAHIYVKGVNSTGGIALAAEGEGNTLTFSMANTHIALGEENTAESVVALLASNGASVFVDGFHHNWLQLAEGMDGEDGVDGVNRLAGVDIRAKDGGGVTVQNFTDNVIQINGARYGIRIISTGDVTLNNALNRTDLSGATMDDRGIDVSAVNDLTATNSLNGNNLSGTDIGGGMGGGNGIYVRADNDITALNSLNGNDFSGASIATADIYVLAHKNGELTNVLQGNHFSNNNTNIRLNTYNASSTINIDNNDVALQDSNTADSGHVVVDCTGAGTVTINAQTC